MRQPGCLALRERVRIILPEEMTVPAQQLRVEAEDHRKKLALVMIELVVWIVPAKLSLESQRQSEEINRSQVGVHRIALQQQQVEFFEEHFSGGAGVEQPGFQQRPLLLSRPVFIQEEFIRQRSHYVLRFAIHLKPECSATARGALRLGFKQRQKALPDVFRLHRRVAALAFDELREGADRINGQRLEAGKLLIELPELTQQQRILVPRICHSVQTPRAQPFLLKPCKGKRADEFSCEGVGLSRLMKAGKVATEAASHLISC